MRLIKKLLLAVLIIFFTIFIYIQFIGSASIKEVRINSWVPDGCSIEHCVGDIDFNAPSCQLKDDGFIYHYNEPIAQLLDAHLPLIREAAPRTGGYIKLLNLQNNEICTYDSTS